MKVFNRPLGKGEVVSSILTGNAASNWDDVENSMWFSAMNLWSAEVNITFVAAADASSTDFTIYRQPHQPSMQGGTYASFPGLDPSTIGSNEDGSPGDAPSSRSAMIPSPSTDRSKPGAATVITLSCMNSATCSGSGTAGRTMAWH